MGAKRLISLSFGRTTGLGMLFLAASGLAAAATQTVTCSSFAQAVELSNATITCNQFNPTGGELTGVTITINGDIFGSITLTNTTQTAQPASGTTTSAFTLGSALPGFSFSSPLFTGTYGTGAQTLGPQGSGTDVFFSGSLTSGTLTAGPLTDTTTSTFGTYQGTGQFSISFNTATNFALTGNVTATHPTHAEVTATVVYTFVSHPSLTCAASGTTGDVGVAFNSPALSISGGVPPFTFSVASGTLPAGLTLNTATGAITGTPTATGTWTLQATDSLGVTATPTCPYSVGQLPTPACPTSGNTGTVGSPFNSPAISVTGGTPPYTFSIVGTLPPGLTLNTATGAITGTPTAPGTWSVQVTDSKGAVGILTCPFSVANTLTLNCPGSGTFGTVGQPFNGPALTGDISGGVPPFTFSIVGTLAPGLTLNPSTGAITGTPTSTGSWSVQVTDATGLVSNSCPYGVGVADMCPAPANQVRYAANLNQGESYINIANPGTDGAPLLGPGFGPSSGNICVNVYAFDPNEEMVSCCSCLVTPDQTVNLGVNRDLISKTLTGVIPSSVTVKLVATLAGAGGVGTNCNNSAASLATAQPACGLNAWGTTLHATPTAGSLATTETPFTSATLSPAELNSLTGRCSSIVGNGSGFGICASCKAGALGGTKF